MNTIPSHKRVSSEPLVSIGMPIYNEAKFLSEALDSVISQTYTNIEIIISDNASTDDTQKLCEEYAAKHPHIQFHRQNTNLGATANFEFVVKHAKGKYFMWAAGHDIWSPNHIEECVAALEQHRGAAVAFATTEWIDAESQPHLNQTGWVDTRGRDPVARYFMIFWGNMNPVLGLIRRDYLTQITLRSVVGMDLLILAKLALMGDFIHAYQAKWYRREFREEQSYSEKLKRYKSSSYGLAKSFIDKNIPFARLPIELIKDVLFANVPKRIRILILLLLIPGLPVKYICGRYL